MATLVSHAMRRYPTAPPEADYSSHGIESSTSRQSWSQLPDNESALSRSMRYAEPWLYGSVRAPSSLLLTPALVLCSCADYVNGTKKSSKKSPSVCKKCKGTRIPLPNVDASKFGTVRCYPTAPVMVPAPIRAGTARVSSKSRPTILPPGDPYDFMRRSRLAVVENGSQFRARSISPSKTRNESKTYGSMRAKSSVNFPTIGRKSILECNVNPYDLMNVDSEPQDASITFVSGQRIRIRPKVVESEYEEIQVQHSPRQTTKKENGGHKVKNSALKPNEKESECNRFKSILKKPTTTFSDTDLNGGPERSPSPALKSGSHFYLPLPANTPRKKVQFLVENEVVSHIENERHYENNVPEADGDHHIETTLRNVPNETEPKPENDYDCVEEEVIPKDAACKLRRSISERVPQELAKVVFHDTMALRYRVGRNDSRDIFNEKELLRKLDGVATVSKLKGFEKIRPRGPPPQPPKNIDNKNNIIQKENCEEEQSKKFKELSEVSDEKQNNAAQKEPLLQEQSKKSKEEFESSNEKQTNVIQKKQGLSQEQSEKCKAEFEMFEEEQGNNNQKETLSQEPFEKPETSNEKQNNFLLKENSRQRSSKKYKEKSEASNEKQKEVLHHEKTRKSKKQSEEKRREEGSAKITLNKTHLKQVKQELHNKNEILNDVDNISCSKFIETVIATDEDKDNCNKLKNSTVTCLEESKIDVSDSLNKRSANEVINIQKNEIIIPSSTVNIREAPPSPPPRKRSNNKQPLISITTIPITQKIKIESPPPVREMHNKTIVKIGAAAPPMMHKLKIKNEYPGTSINNVTISDPNQGKTSIMINGDDCYCTVNVSDDVPLYQSSVVVKDSGVKSEPSRRSSSVYITGTFIGSAELKDDGAGPNLEKIEARSVQTKIDTEKLETGISQTNLTSDCVKQVQKELVENKSSKELEIDEKQEPENYHTEVCSTEMLKRILCDPVEAVKRNLVPHVCGKADASVRPSRRKKTDEINDIVASFLEDSLLSPTNDDFQVNPVAQLIEESFMKLRNHDGNLDDDKDACSEHSSSTQYEVMDPGSDCYTDNSNRSSVTEEELSTRSKFYELLAESAVEVSEGEEHHYESIKANADPIYEEIEIPPPLPANPPPPSIIDDLQLDKEFTTRSIFEGASKYDILSYLVDAKERGIVPEDSYTFNFNNTGIIIEDDGKETVGSFNKNCHMSTVSDSSEDSSLVISGALIEDKVQRSIEVERNDSGVGSETSKSSLSKYRSKPEPLITCEDCEGPVDLQEEHEPLICRKCLKRRSERKEIITEVVETEEKYSRDLQIILEEFYQPMLVAGLLTSEQLSAIFLNVEELLENSQALAERLRDAVEIATEQGDEDLLTVNIGKLFLEAAPMLHAFETYCVRQGAASLLLASLEKEKELLRIFLRVSQMENTVLRRMNLNSFLMVPVQRVTKYPLLLARLYKVTPTHHETREQLKESQTKIELHLNHMNSETKDVPSKLWRRISNNPGRRASSEMDLVNIKLRKIAVDVLEWNHEEAKFALEGKLLFTQPTDNNWRKGRTIKLTPINALLVTNGKALNSVNNRPEPTEETLIFSRHSGVREAALLLVRDKNGRYSLLRDPLYLDRCVIAADPAWQSYFEVQELLGKDTFIFKADDDDQTRIWYRHLQYYAQGMGAWRKRRNALANIMINGMGLRS